MDIFGPIDYLAFLGLGRGRDVESQVLEGAGPWPIWLRLPEDHWRLNRVADGRSDAGAPSAALHEVGDRSDSCSKTLQLISIGITKSISFQNP